MKSFPPEMASAAAREKLKCSRNKRKFRQDPPLQNQGSGEENPTANFPADFNAMTDGHGVDWDSRSAEATARKSSGADSILKEDEIGTSLASSKTNEVSSVYQDHLKLMRWFTTRKGSQVGDSWTEGKSEHHREGLQVSDGSEKEEDLDELEEAEWDDHTEGELEELLLKSLDSLYKEAIGKIETRGYNADDALMAVLRQGRCYGGKDAVSNIVDNALVYLTGKESEEVDELNIGFADLNELQRSGLKDMVHLLTEVRPALSRGDAMWCLLMCDMNVPLACVMDDVSPQNVNDSRTGSGETAEQTKSSNMDLAHCGLDKSNKVKAPKGSVTQTPVESLASSTKGAFQHSATLSTSPSPPVPCLALPSLPSVSNEEGYPPLTSPEIPSVSSSEVLTSVNRGISSNAEVPESNTPGWDVLSSTAKDREQLPEGEKIPAPVTPTSGHHQGSFDGELARIVCAISSRTSQTQESTGDSCTTTGQLHHQSDPSPLVEEVDKNVTGETLNPSNPCAGAGAQRAAVCELPAGNDSGCHQKPPDALTKVLKSDSGRQDELDVKSSENSSTFVAAKENISTLGNLGTVDAQSLPGPGSAASGDALPAVKTCISANSVALDVENTQGGQGLKEIPQSPLSNRERLVNEKGDMDDQRDDMILKLLQRVRELETQLTDRTEWAKQKVMQAATRLTKDLQELKALRLEREEANRVKKEKQASEDSATKKQADLETALRKASGQADRANATVRKLEAENAELRAEMEAAKLSAAESAASCQEIGKRERKYAKRAQAWEKQKAKLQEELSDEKKKYASLNQQLLVVKERLQQAEVRWRQEEKAREEAMLRAANERRAKEQAEAAAKRREESLRRKAESNYQRHRDDIQRLECEIAQLRTTAEAAQLATSRWGPGVAVTPHMMELSNMQSLKDTNMRLRRELLELQEMTEGLARRDVRRDRECVMCMCEEMSVVFLPCAHQVVCIKCNELHEKQGMRDCPSCRTHIQQRIRVFGVSS